MAKRVVNESSLTSVADAIRDKSGTTSQLVFPEGFISAIGSITPGDGGITPNGTINITTNGIHDVTSFASANVNVPTTGGDIVYGEDIEVDSLSELHAWNKYAIGGTVTETKVNTLSISGDQTGLDSIYEPVDYADEYDIPNGKIVLVNPTENVTFTSSTNAQILLGKYIQTYETPNQYATAASPSGKFYRIDSTADIEYDKTTYPTTGRSLRVSPAYRLNYAGSEDKFIGIVVSEDSTAYPQNGTQDGYKYVYNGTLNDAGGTGVDIVDITIQEV